MSTMTFIRQMEVRRNVDVLVVGGGPAGVTAAVAAARNGMSVFLVEGQGYLGGMGTGGMVPAFMNITDGVNPVCGGIGLEIIERCKNVKDSKYFDILSIEVEVLKRVYDEILLESGVEFVFMTQLVGAESKDGSIQSAVFSSKSGIYAVSAKIYIDCTGDGDLAFMAGADYEKGDENGTMMPGTLCSIWGGIDWENIPQHKQSAFLDDAFEAGIFTNKDRQFPGVWRIGETTGGSNLGHAFGVDGTDETTLTKAFVEERKRLLEYLEYYRRYISGFEKCNIVTSAPLMGIRETRRIIGDYVLNINDYIKRAKFQDDIGRYNYPVDIHPSSTDEESFRKHRAEITKDMKYGPGENYGIPYRTLVPKGTNNLLVAGRCISCDRTVLGSVRVMPGCYITGHAAGTAASIAVRDDKKPREIDVAKLQNLLREAGAYLPEEG